MFLWVLLGLQAKYYLENSTQVGGKVGKANTPLIITDHHHQAFTKSFPDVGSESSQNSEQSLFFTLLFVVVWFVFTVAHLFV